VIVWACTNLSVYTYLYTHSDNNVGASSYVLAVSICITKFLMYTVHNCKLFEKNIIILLLLPIHDFPISLSMLSYNSLGYFYIINIYSHTKIEIHTVKPLITNTSEEFIKCRLDNFSISFILYYVNFSVCENK